MRRESKKSKENIVVNGQTVKVNAILLLTCHFDQSKTVEFFAMSLKITEYDRLKKLPKPELAVQLQMRGIKAPKRLSKTALLERISAHDGTKIPAQVKITDPAQLYWLKAKEVTQKIRNTKI